MVELMMKNMLKIPTNSIADVINQSAIFRSTCDGIKAELSAIKMRQASFESRVAKLEAAIADYVITQVQNGGVGCAISAYIHLNPYSEPCTLTLSTKQIAAPDSGSEFFSASADVSFKSETTVFLNPRISALVGDNDDENHFDGGPSYIDVSANHGIADMIVDATMACAAFVKATVPNDQCPLHALLVEYVNERKAQKANDSACHDLYEVYAGKAANAFANEYHRVTEADIKELWDAPAGTQLRYLELSAQKHREYSEQPKIYFRANPYTISVFGEGSGRKLVNVRKDGYCSMTARKLATMTQALLDGSFVGDQNMNVLYRSIVVDDQNFDFMNLKGPIIVDI